MADQALTCPMCGSGDTFVKSDPWMQCRSCYGDWQEQYVKSLRSHNKLLTESLAKVAANIRTYTPTTHGELQQADAALAFRGEGSDGK